MRRVVHQERRYIGDNRASMSEDYGRKIRRGKEWDALEDYVDAVGADYALNSIARAMGDSELGETLAYIFRNEDYESPYLA